MEIACVIVISGGAGLMVWLFVLALGLHPAAAAVIAAAACVLGAVGLMEICGGDDAR